MKLGFGYTVNEENITNQGGDFELLPDMNAVLEVTAADLEFKGDPEDPDEVQAKLVIDVKEPAEYAGRKLWAYWLIHDKANSNRYAKFGKPNFDRLTKAVGIEGDPDDTDDLLFKEFVARIGTSVGGPKPDGGKYNDRNEIKKFYFPSEPEKYPEIGVIAGAVQAKPVEAKKPVAQAPTAGKKPWAK